MHPFRIFFETTPFCHAYTNYLSLKDLEKDGLNLLRKTFLEKLAEILLYNFHREHILLKLKIKKLLRKISSKNLTAGVFFSSMFQVSFSYGMMYGISWACSFKK